jgi:hypothetical protein
MLIQRFDSLGTCLQKRLYYPDGSFEGGFDILPAADGGGFVIVTDSYTYLERKPAILKIPE